MKRLKLLLILISFLAPLVSAAPDVGTPTENHHPLETHSQTLTSEYNTIDRHIDQHIDQCDQCCHGHCSHLTPIAYTFSLPERSTKSVFSSLLIGVLSRIPYPIDRPPIA
ncbi:hypothetical protein [Gilvimarinus chinensis]|uniref:hypothetical protein n=1 Tax=Gilvimarinus chinensis TaxID=396005 RepID=UPI0012FC11E7|nr:hypothetical protein [Gilvimarinus chinensis]